MLAFGNDNINANILEDQLSSPWEVNYDERYLAMVVVIGVSSSLLWEYVTLDSLQNILTGSPRGIFVQNSG